jgi:hypothetical protein
MNNDNCIEMDLKTFYEMFMAVSYSQGQSLFDYYNLEDYILYSNDYSEYVADEICDQISEYTEDFEIKGYIETLENNRSICRILNSFNFRKVIEENYEYLDVMRNIFFDFISDKSLKNYIKITTGRQK